MARWRRKYLPVASVPPALRGATQAQLPHQGLAARRPRMAGSLEEGSCGVQGGSFLNRLSPSEHFHPLNLEESSAPVPGNRWALAAGCTHRALAVGAFYPLAAPPSGSKVFEQPAAETRRLRCRSPRPRRRRRRLRCRPAGANGAHKSLGRASSSRKCVILSLVAVVLTICLAVGLGVGLSKGGDSGSPQGDAVAVPSPTPAPSPSPPAESPPPAAGGTYTLMGADGAEAQLSPACAQVAKSEWSQRWRCARMHVTAPAAGSGRSKVPAGRRAPDPQPSSSLPPNAHACLAAARQDAALWRCHPMASACTLSPARPPPPLPTTRPWAAQRVVLLPHLQPHRADVHGHGSGGLVRRGGGADGGARGAGRRRRHALRRARLRRSQRARPQLQQRGGAGACAVLRCWKACRGVQVCIFTPALLVLWQAWDSAWPDAPLCLHGTSSC